MEPSGSYAFTGDENEMSERVIEEMKKAKAAGKDILEIQIKSPEGQSKTISIPIPEDIRDW